jgi:hypothetical protein
MRSFVICILPNIIGMVNSGNMRHGAYITHWREDPVGDIHQWKVRIKIDIKEIEETECGDVGWTHLTQGQSPVTALVNTTVNLLTSMNSRTFLDQPSDYQLLNKNSISWNQLIECGVYSLFRTVLLY